MPLTTPIVATDPPAMASMSTQSQQKVISFLVQTILMGSISVNISRVGPLPYEAALPERSEQRYFWRSAQEVYVPSFMYTGIIFKWLQKFNRSERDMKFWISVREAKFPYSFFIYCYTVGDEWVTGSQNGFRAQPNYRVFKRQDERTFMRFAGFIQRIRLLKPVVSNVNVPGVCINILRTLGNFNTPLSRHPTPLLIFSSVLFFKVSLSQVAMQGPQSVPFAQLDLSNFLSSPVSRNSNQSWNCTPITTSLQPYIFTLTWGFVKSDVDFHWNILCWVILHPKGRSVMGACEVLN